MDGKTYNLIMEQGARAYYENLPYDQNPHTDDESKAAWVEGWQWAAHNERKNTTRSVQ
ncbi:hypothetical protein K08M3_51100 [Vibrio alginolyticus]|jgi:hypothetical protein|uniref:Ribosome modulation factor n=1 Tax=Vibrio alginolyticus TaxID=663 RepID=A0A1W6UWE3_VIBAL|nr:hypothetical protein [Vibrio alginolyticus]WKV20110.1 hypothetical protein [Vibrio parahaemolyticus]ARP06620.1 hypothetical protein K04M1_50970 [Vibrio alginolyticus]ARP11753.1 hypothetical protein K04M3_51840 [Vibrio alginolyticus]ARP16806.1 hypothetical protein K04M5_51540 [Vibrio alginolyticus]ARP21843.1 hypothetical protein K05K4_51410 [Vibrio alginolyticus]